MTWYIIGIIGVIAFVSFYRAKTLHAVVFAPAAIMRALFVALVSSVVGLLVGSIIDEEWPIVIAVLLGTLLGIKQAFQWLNERVIHTEIQGDVVVGPDHNPPVLTKSPSRTTQEDGYAKLIPDLVVFCIGADNGFSKANLDLARAIIAADELIIDKDRAIGLVDKGLGEFRTFGDNKKSYLRLKYLAIEEVLENDLSLREVKRLNYVYGELRKAEIGKIDREVAGMADKIEKMITQKLRSSAA